MKNKLAYICLTFIALFSCNSKHIQLKSSTPGQDSLLIEYFADSTGIGRKTTNKIELSKFCLPDSCFVDIKFYSKNKNKWLLKNEYHFLKDGILDCDVELSDFNNDGLNDMTYVSAMAARGANQVRTLFIYDKESDQLVWIRNSDHYPNLMYNSELDCIDAFHVYAGCTTNFLKISGDTLKKIASVQVFDGLTVTTYDDHDNEKIIFQDFTYETDYIRFRSYDPLQESDEY